MDIKKIKYWDYNKQEYRLRNKPTRKLTYNQLQNKIDTLNKGIDETIEEIEFEINNNFVVGGTYNRLNCLLQDLKKLKGE